MIDRSLPLETCDTVHGNGAWGYTADHTPKTVDALVRMLVRRRAPCASPGHTRMRAETSGMHIPWAPAHLRAATWWGRMCGGGRFTRTRGWQVRTAGHGANLLLNVGPMVRLGPGHVTRVAPGRRGV